MATETKISTSVTVTLTIEVDVGSYVPSCTLDHVTSNSVAKARGLVHEVFNNRKDMRLAQGVEPKIRAVTTTKGTSHDEA